MWLVAGTPQLQGSIDGDNCIFVAASAFNATRAQVAINGLVRLPGSVTDNGYTLAGRTLTLGEAPVPRDVVALWAEPLGAAPILLPQPPAGSVAVLMPPRGSAQAGDTQRPRGSVMRAPLGPTGSVRVG